MRVTGAVPVDEVRATAYTIPTEQPESDGTLEWDSHTILLVEARAGSRTGIGYTYTQAGAGDVVNGKLAGVVEGKDALGVGALWASMWHEVRNYGQTGLAATAISAVDIALWDLKARLLDLPLTVALDAVHDSTPIYGSGGFCNYSDSELARQLAGLGRRRDPAGEDEDRPGPRA